MTFTTVKPVLSYNTKNALVKGIIIGIVTTLSYLLVIVITTPNLQAFSAIDASIRANSGIIFGLGIGMGVQVFISASALLMTVIFVVEYTKGLRGFSGIVIVGIVGLDIFFLAFISGASMNPA